MKNLNLAHNFWTVTVTAFIFHMYIPCDKTFPSVQKYLTLRPSLWPLTFILKTWESSIVKCAFIFHVCILCYKTFPSVRPLPRPSDLDAAIRENPCSTEHSLSIFILTNLNCFLCLKYSTCFFIRWFRDIGIQCAFNLQWMVHSNFQVCRTTILITFK